MPNRPNPFEGDIWQEIYTVNDPAIRVVLILLYRMILEMHNADKQAELIATALSNRRVIVWKTWHKAVAILGGFLFVLDTAIHIGQIIP